MIDVNVKGALYAVRAALPELLKSEAADIVTIASEAGRRGLPYEVAYCASKFAQVGMTQRARPRAARAGRALHERLPRRRGDRLRDGPRADAGDAAAGRDDVGRRTSPRRSSSSSRGRATIGSSRSPSGRLPRPPGAEAATSRAPLGSPVDRQHRRGEGHPRHARAARCRVVAIASRDASRGERRRPSGIGIPTAHGSYEALLADPERRRRLHPPPEPPARGVDDRRRPGRQARPVREAAGPHRGRRRADGRRSPRPRGCA